MSGPVFREVKRTIGEHGITSRVLHAHGSIEHLIAELACRGCGAWVGRSACGEPATTLLSGYAWLIFRTYRSAHGENTFVYAAVCDKHAASRDALTADMPEDISVAQLAEFARWRRKMRQVADTSVILTRL